MTSPSTQSRACKGCYQLKVRCHPSPANPSTCERCQRAGKECVTAGSRRRPRDRIAQLEAQVAGLTRALQNQQLSRQSPSASPDVRAIVRTGQQEESPIKNGLDTQSSTSSKAMAFLDSRVSMAAQQLALDTYIQRLHPLLPTFPLLDSNLVSLRSDAPILLFSIITFATSYLLSSNTRDELIQEAMRILAFELIAKPSRRLEVV